MPESHTGPRRAGTPFTRPTSRSAPATRPAAERARFQREPADILITTPESLYLLLTSNAHEALKAVDTIIIDEIHALVPTKRGAHMALSMERLQSIVTSPLQRIGLSATQRPLDEVARFLGGSQPRAPKKRGQTGVRPRSDREVRPGSDQGLRSQKLRSTTSSARTARRQIIALSRSWTLRRRRSSS